MRFRPQQTKSKSDPLAARMPEPCSDPAPLVCRIPKTCAAASVTKSYSKFTSQQTQLRLTLHSTPFHRPPAASPWLSQEPAGILPPPQQGCRIKSRLRNGRRLHFESTDGSLTSHISNSHSSAPEAYRNASFRSQAWSSCS